MTDRTDSTTLLPARGHRGSTLFAILSLVALICAGVTAYFLYAETAHYQEAPTVWSK